MTDTPQFLSDRLRMEGEKTAEFFASLHPKQWQQTVYTEGAAWTVRSVLVHYVTAERGFLKIFTQICAGGEGASPDFDIDRYNASQQKKMQDVSPAELLEQFNIVRAQMVQLAASFTQEDLQKEGRHPYLGLTTLGEMVKMVYRHNQIHHRDMRRLI